MHYFYEKNIRDFWDFLVLIGSKNREPEKSQIIFRVKLCKNYAAKFFTENRFLQHYAFNEHF
jgi:hypothetical protein